MSSIKRVLILITKVNVPQFLLKGCKLLSTVWQHFDKWYLKNNSKPYAKQSSRSIFDSSVCKPLEIIFQSCVEKGKFPYELKKANMMSAFQESNKRELKNYWLISLLPVSGKIFERLLYNSMFKFFTENSLIFYNQLGFKPGYLRTNQLLSITHKIYSCVLKHFQSFW